MNIDDRIEKLVLKFKYRVLCMLSAKDQDNYINRLIDQYNLISTSSQLKKRSNDLIHNVATPLYFITGIRKTDIRLKYE